MLKPWVHHIMGVYIFSEFGARWYLGTRMQKIF